MRSVADRILRRVRARSSYGNRLVFTARDFGDFGDRAAVDQALSRLAKAGALRRIRRGLYDLPRVNPILKRVPAPDVDAVVDAIARRDDITIVPSGIAAANRLGLTTAVPAKNDYLTDGPSRTLKVGTRLVRLKHAGRKVMAMKDRPAGDVVRALHWLGPDIAKDDQVVDVLRRRLPHDVKQDLAKARPSMTAWVARIADRVVA